jgi:predicted NBD/HSP70 family sugar kinase
VKILVIDIGGSSVKVLATGKKEPVKIPSGPKLTPKQMVRSVREATRDWSYEVVSIGIPGKVLNGRPAENPPNLGRGWMRFDFQKAFGKPVKVLNDAALQALGNYHGKRMLFLGLGTGLGSALVLEGILHPLELGDLPYEEGTYAGYVGKAGLEQLGKKEWTRHVREVVRQLARAMQTDSIIIGGGKAKLIRRLPCHAIRSDNSSAFTGGFRLWETLGASSL